jgi:membrane protease YdiL (CAAX protease family)
VVATPFGVGAVCLLHINPPPIRFVSIGRPSEVTSIFTIGVLAVTNAGLEEWLWRVLTYRALLQRTIPKGSAVVLQAIGFGIAHRRGLPGGSLGMIGAAAFGLSQGLLRLRGRSFLELLLVHGIVDGAILPLVWHRWTVFGGAHFGR